MIHVHTESSGKLPPWKNFWRYQPLSHQAMLYGLPYLWFKLLLQGAVRTILWLRSSCSVFSFPSRNKCCQISPTNKHISSSITTVLYLVLSKVPVPDTSEYQPRLPRCKQYCCSETILISFSPGKVQTLCVKALLTFPMVTVRTLKTTWVAIPNYYFSFSPFNFKYQPDIQWDTKHCVMK